MPRTRHSQPSAAASSSPEPEIVPTTRKAKNALKKLAIHGKPTLYGEKPPEQSERAATYHHRGGVYAVTDETPEAWILTQPARYRKRSSLSAMDHVSNSEDDDDDEDEQPQNNKRKREESIGEEERRVSGVRPKRARRNPNGTFDGVEVDDEQYLGDDTPRRNRRSRREVYYGRTRRPAAHPIHAEDVAPRKRRQQRSLSPEDDSYPTSRGFDFALVGGREETSCRDAARRRAQMMGFEVSPIPDRLLLKNNLTLSKLEEKQAQDVARCLAQLININAKVHHLSQHYEEVGAQIELHNEMLEKDARRSPDRDSRPEVYRASTATEPPPDDHRKEIVEDPRTKSASPRAYQRTRAGLELTPPPNDHVNLARSDLKVPTQSSSPDAAAGAMQYHDSIEGDVEVANQNSEEMQIDSPIDNGSKLEKHSPHPQAEIRHAASPHPTNISDADSDDSNVKITTSRHDSASTPPPTFTKPDQLTSSHLQHLSPAPNHPSLPIQLPQVNKNGDRLRWSLPGNVSDRERAEAAIFTGRLPNESKSAKRRRVRRERKMLESWGDVGGAVAEGGVAGGRTEVEVGA